MSTSKPRVCLHCDKPWTRLSRNESLRFCPDCDTHVSFCFQCKQAKPNAQFSLNTSTRNGLESSCRACGVHRKWKARYGISPEAYDTLLVNQAGRCAICQNFPDDDQPLHVDHCHEGGQVRGLLCSRCNTAIGLLKEDLDVIQRAVNYIELAHSV